MRLPVQQVQIAADGGEGGAQVMGDVGHGLLQLPVSVEVLAALLPQQAELGVQPGSQTPGMGIPGREGEEVVGVPLQPVLHLVADLLQGPGEGADLAQQDQDQNPQQGTQQPGEHANASFPPVTSNSFVGTRSCPGRW